MVRHDIADSGVKHQKKKKKINHDSCPIIFLHLLRNDRPLLTLNSQVSTESGMCNRPLNIKQSGIYREWDV
jgi:hypothetical protein